MADPKPAGTPVDTERVIRELLDALKSLKGATGAGPSFFRLAKTNSNNDLSSRRKILRKRLRLSVALFPTLPARASHRRRVSRH